MIKRIFFILIILLIPAFALAATYYVNCEGSTCTDASPTCGTYSSPWSDLSRVDNQSFSDGDDIYFAEGTTCTVTNDIDINHSGVSAANPSVIGCYNTNNSFICTGTKPIIQQSGEDLVVFTFHDSEYLTFKDLNLKNTHASWEDSSSIGIASEDDAGTDGNDGYGYLTVDNCDFSRP